MNRFIVSILLTHWPPRCFFKKQAYRDDWLARQDGDHMDRRTRATSMRDPRLKRLPRHVQTAFRKALRAEKRRLARYGR